jgi:Mrp family chromosome partitioning ATPase
MVQGGQVKLRAVCATTSEEAEATGPSPSSLPTLLIPVLQASQLRAEFDSWLDRARRVADFVLLEGPPLGRTMLSATLAGSSTGLLLVMQAGSTSKDQLSLASERARSAGARVLGVIVRRKRLRLPAWLRLLQRS